MEDSAGNNLSFPVIWAEGVPKDLPGSVEEDPALNGEWWYWWGTAADGTPLSCLPDLDATTDLCIDGSAPGGDWVHAYVQKDSGNVWQADNWTPEAGVIVPDDDLTYIDVRILDRSGGRSSSTSVGGRGGR